MDIHRNIFSIVLGFATMFHGFAMNEQPPTCPGMRNTKYFCLNNEEKHLIQLDFFSIIIVDQNDHERVFYFKKYSVDTLTKEEKNDLQAVFDEENYYLKLGDKEAAKKYAEFSKKKKEHFYKDVQKPYNKQADEHREKIHETNQADCWLIWEMIGLKKHIFAQLGISICIDAREHERFKALNLIEFGLHIQQNYRKAGLGSRIMREVLNYLKSLKPFQNATFCLRINSIDTYGQAMAKGLDFVLAMKDTWWDTVLYDGKTEFIFKTSLDLYTEKIEH